MSILTHAYHFFWADLCWKSRAVILMWLVIAVLGAVGLRIHP